MLSSPHKVSCVELPVFLKIYFDFFPFPSWQIHEVKAVDIIPEKVTLINDRKSPIQDEYIEKYLAEKELNLRR